MKVLLVAACLLAVALAQEEPEFVPNFEIAPGAKKTSFLYQIQKGLIEGYATIFPDGVRIQNTAQLGIMTAKNDLCKINKPDYQSQGSVILGKTCKKAFVKVFNADEDQCSGVFCDVLEVAEVFLNDTMRAMIAAEFDKDFFKIIETEILNPVMEYNCRCSGKMMDAWMGCKHKIGEADIWYTVMNFGGFNTSAAYLEGEDWLDFWVDVVKDRLPWDDMSLMLERTMANLCQTNQDDEGKCYTYFYKAFNTLYQWFLKSTGGVPAVNKRGGNNRNNDVAVPEQCSTYDLSAYADMEAEDISFGDIKEAVIEKFCVEECEDVYQDTFLGCCTASMIQDEVLETSVKNTATGMGDIYKRLYPENEDAANSGISEYFGYYENAMAMLRNPTCTETSVKYDVTPCGGAGGEEELGEVSSCEGLSSKKAKICKKKAKKAAKAAGDEEEEGGNNKKNKKNKNKKNKGGKKGGKGKKNKNKESA